MTKSRKLDMDEKLKERFELALCGSKTSILDWDMVDNTLYVSPSWKEMLGYRDEELPNTTHTWKRLVHKQDVVHVMKSVREHIKKHIKVFENNHRLRHKDGHWVWILGRARIIYDEQGNAVRMIGTHTDITKEKELQLQYSHYAQILEQIQDSVISFDMDGFITSWNKGSKILFGYETDEVLGKHFSMLFPKNTLDLYEKMMAELKEKGEYRTEIQLRRKTNKPLYAVLSLSSLKDEDGNTIGFVSYAHDITEQKKVEAILLEQKNILRYQAHHDALTRLPNRVLFFDRMEQSIRKTERLGKSFALFFIDLDKFKHINDSLGHGIGDRVLKVVARRIEETIRKEDTLSRLSGDEFTVIMEDLNHPEDASLLAEKILTVLQKPMYIDEYTLYISGSIGISLYPQDATDADSLLKYADTAMYKAKENGRNTFQFYASEMTQHALERMAMKTSLKEAIEKEELVVHYQPQMDAKSERMIGLEALVRWQHPSRGLLHPDKFIALAEETGLIIDIDRWVMKTAMKEVSHWHKEGLIPDVLALNLSIKQLEGHNFLKEINECLTAFDFKPQWLELEIPEGQVMKNHKDSIQKLQTLNKMGISISIDDFGTGYSSLSLLKRLPINRLKIDRSFIKDIPADEEDMAIVKAIIALADSLKLNIIAEGVETEEQKAFLLANGCTYMQGYYYSRPISSELMRKFLQKKAC
ncbi:bifunctional diguanylate cyclase/phosphodiesterase [Sulfurovum riftiae]|uniref:Histidine kinase n=1 Tax=Sulfurovum riftiae TaxID=1630136 RepID=A0A151CIF1_9BACT|nr:GGDEF and EAL domain-containing protein [Sulfurovum riftiae]KYJ87291.1 histidine kinase [Sulfurovum riftiae]